MIQATINMDALYIQLEGHAMTGEPGKDLVCAAASILLQALMESCVRDEKRSDGAVEVHYATGSGYADCDIDPEPQTEWHTRSRAKLELVADGLRLLERSHPEAIDVEML